MRICEKYQNGMCTCMCWRMPVCTALGINRYGFCHRHSEFVYWHPFSATTMSVQNQIFIFFLCFFFIAALLAGTLRTYQKAGCDAEYISLSCPRGTSISIEVAQYGNTLKGKMLHANTFIYSLSSRFVFSSLIDVPTIHTYEHISFYVANRLPFSARTYGCIAHIGIQPITHPSTHPPTHPRTHTRIHDASSNQFCVILFFIRRLQFIAISFYSLSLMFLSESSQWYTWPRSLRHLVVCCTVRY